MKYLVLFILVVLASVHLNLDYFSLFTGLDNFKVFLSDSFPPDFSVFEAAVFGTIETLQIAFLGTVFGTLLSLPVSILASKNLFSTSISASLKFVLAAIRTFPALLWAILFVMIVGLGPLAGVLATTMYTVGYLSKMFNESIEGIDPDSTLALKGIGLNKLQIIQYVVIPEASHALLSQILFIFEYNLRGSTILGFVGAGGVGFYISNYLKLLQYDKISMVLIVVFVAVLIIDIISSKIRTSYQLK
jgi:phosphonate transport system permease protein